MFKVSSVVTWYTYICSGMVAAAKLIIPLTELPIICV